jgi:hypothetical protein
MPRSRKWGVESLNMNKSTDTSAPLHAPLLSPGEIRRKRIELCEEMLTLLMADAELTARPRQALQKIYASLGSVRRQL